MLCVVSSTTCGSSIWLKHVDQVAGVERDLQLVAFDHCVELVDVVAHLRAGRGEADLAFAVILAGHDGEANDVGVVTGEEMGDTREALSRAARSTTVRVVCVLGTMAW